MFISLSLSLFPSLSSSPPPFLPWSLPLHTTLLLSLILAFSFVFFLLSRPQPRDHFRRSSRYTQPFVASCRQPPSSVINASAMAVNCLRKSHHLKVSPCRKLACRIGSSSTTNPKSKGKSHPSACSGKSIVNHAKAEPLRVHSYEH